VTALDARGGGYRWTVDLPEVKNVLLLAVDGGVLYVSGTGDASPDAAIVALDAATGRRLWDRRVQGEYPAVRAVAADGRVFAVERRGDASGEELVARDGTTGDEIWRTAVPLPAEPGAIEVALGAVYLVGEDGLLRAFDAATGAPGWTYPTGKWWSEL